MNGKTTGKELIERIALEEAQKLGQESIDDETIAYVTNCLARIDAERWKWAVARMIPLMLPSKHKPQLVARTFEEYSQEASDANEYRAGEEIPLFLSPTIHEGMALVPVEPTQEQCEAAYCCMSDGPEAIYKAMIAAAQGERNAE